MIVVAMKDGVTSGGKVYRQGDLFPMTEIMKKDFGGLSEEKLMKRQKRVYGEVLFRMPLPEELYTAYDEKRVSLDQVNKEQRKIIAVFASEKADREKRKASAIAETVEPEQEEELTEEKEKKETISEPEPQEEVAEEAPPETEEVEKTVEETEKKTTGRKKSGKK